MDKGRENLILGLLVLGFCIPIVLHVLASGLGGSLVALLALYLFLFSSYRIVRYSLPTSVDELFFLVCGVFLTLISAGGYLLAYLGFRMLPWDYLVLSILLCAATYFATRSKKMYPLTLEYRKFMVVIGCFLITFFVYSYPSLPNFFSPCTFGFDCTLQIDYSRNVYTTGLLIPPTIDWRYYPTGFHITTAFLTHAIEKDMPNYGNFIYPFSAFITALTIGMLCLMLYGRVKLPYILLFLVLVVSSVYPASDLIHFGFWGSNFGNYYCILFALLMLYYVERKCKVNFLIILFLYGSLIGYQVLTTPFLLILLGAVVIFQLKKDFKTKLKTLGLFYLIFGILFTVYIGFQYSRYLAYTYEPTTIDSSVLAFNNLTINQGGGFYNAEIKGRFYINATDMRMEKVYASHDKLLPLLLTAGLSPSKFKAFVDVGRINIDGTTPAGNILFYNFKMYGYLTLILFILGVLHMLEDKNNLLPFIFSSTAYAFIFCYMEHHNTMSIYYSTKIMHYFLYPMLMTAVYGVDRLLTGRKLKNMLITILVIGVVLYNFNLLNIETLYMLIGDRTDNYTTGYNWAILEFNRVQRGWDMSRGIQREHYGIQGFLDLIQNKTKS